MTIPDGEKVSSVTVVLLTLDLFSSLPSSTTIWFPLNVPVLELASFGSFFFSAFPFEGTY